MRNKKQACYLSPSVNVTTSSANTFEISNKDNATAADEIIESLVFAFLSLR